MDKSAPPGAAARPPGAEGTVHVRQVISNAGDSYVYAVAAWVKGKLDL